MMDKGGKIYVCGSTKMGKEVQQLITEWFGEDFIKNGRLVSELWGGNSI